MRNYLNSVVTYHSVNRDIFFLSMSICDRSVSFSMVISAAHVNAGPMASSELKKYFSKKPPTDSLNPGKSEKNC